MRGNTVVKLEEECKELKMILRNLTHEMGNALTLLGYSIKNIGKENGVKENENWEYINNDFDYICRLFKNLAAYNHSQELMVEEMDICKLLKSVTSELKDEYNESGVDINYKGIDSAFIKGDVIKLKQVFINIIKNAYEAIKYKNEDGIIEINITDNVESYEISIKDNGCGIAHENIDKIFEPMYTENKEGGTGLGLPVCKSIVESHGGSIRVESKEGCDTTFFVYINKRLQKWSQ